MNSTLVGLSISNILGKSPFLTFSHSTKFSFQLFKNFQLTRSSAKFLSSRNMAFINIKDSSFSHFNNGAIQISNDDPIDEYTFYDGNVNDTIGIITSGQLSLDSCYFRYFDILIDYADQKDHIELIYSEVPTSITNCLFFEIVCGTTGSIANVVHSRKFQLYQISNPNNTIDFQFFMMDCSVSISNYVVDKCEDFDNLEKTCTIKNCAFDKIVGDKDQPDNNGWAFSICSAKPELSYCTWTRIYGSKENLENSQYFIAFQPQPVYKSITNINNITIDDPIIYPSNNHNFTQFKAYSVGFFYPYPINSATTVSYSQFQNGTVCQGCIQALFQIAATEILGQTDKFRGLFQVHQCIFTELSLYRDIATDSTCLFILNGLLTVKDCNFLQNQREISCISNTNQYAEVVISQCVSDKPLESMLARTEGASEMYITTSGLNFLNSPDQATLDLSFDSNPTVSIMFPTQEFTPSLKPTVLPTADNISVYSPPSNLVGAIATVAGIISILYFAFTVYLRFFRQSNFIVIGKLDEHYSDLGCCACCSCCPCCKKDPSDYSYSYSESSSKLGYTIDDQDNENLTTDGEEYFGHTRLNNNNNRGMDKNRRKKNSQPNDEFIQDQPQLRAMSPTTPVQPPGYSQLPSRAISKRRMSTSSSSSEEV